MAKINEKKLELYANKLYRGELARYKKKVERDDIFSIGSFFRQEEKIRRVPISKSQEKTVLNTHKNKCVICSKPYDKDDFEIHHINGNRSKTVTKNLVPLCHRCHKKITTTSKAKLRDHIVKQGGKKPRSPFEPPEIKLPKFKF